MSTSARLDDFWPCFSQDSCPLPDSLCSLVSFLSPGGIRLFPATTRVPFPPFSRSAGIYPFWRYSVLESLVFIFIILCILVPKALANTRSYVHVWIFLVAFLRRIRFVVLRFDWFGAISRLRGIVSPMLNCWRARSKKAPANRTCQTVTNAPIVCVSLVTFPPLGLYKAVRSM